MTTPPLAIDVPAKINLFLRILGRRPDGYHAIETVFLPLDAPVDRVTLRQSPSPGIQLHCAAAGVPADQRNLAWQAARVFLDAAGPAAPAGVTVTLDKGIPVAAGLGGGSADAAAVLRGLNALCGHPLERPTLLKLARELGADVPFFLDPRPALGTGIGECLQPIALAADLDIVLVNAGFPVPVAWAYAHWQPSDKQNCCDAAALQKLLAAMRAGDPDGIAAAAGNHLEAAIFRKFPLLGLLADSLRDAGATAVHVSGSGPTLFALCPPGRRAVIAARVRDDYDSAVRIWETRVARTKTDKNDDAALPSKK